MYTDQYAKADVFGYNGLLQVDVKRTFEISGTLKEVNNEYYNLIIWGSK